MTNRCTTVALIKGVRDVNLDNNNGIRFVCVNLMIHSVQEVGTVRGTEGPSFVLAVCIKLGYVVVNILERGVRRLLAASDAKQRRRIFLRP